MSRPPWAIPAAVDRLDGVIVTSFHNSASFEGSGLYRVESEGEPDGTPVDVVISVSDPWDDQKPDDALPGQLVNTRYSINSASYEFNGSSRTYIVHATVGETVRIAISGGEFRGRDKGWKPVNRIRNARVRCPSPAN